MLLVISSGSAASSAVAVEESRGESILVIQNKNRTPYQSIRRNREQQFSEYRLHIVCSDCRKNKIHTLRRGIAARNTAQVQTALPCRGKGEKSTDGCDDPCGGCGLPRRRGSVLVARLPALRGLRRGQRVGAVGPPVPVHQRCHLPVGAVPLLQARPDSLDARQAGEGRPGELVARRGGLKAGHWHWCALPTAAYHEFSNKDNKRDVWGLLYGGTATVYHHRTQQPLKSMCTASVSVPLQNVQQGTL